MKINEITLLSNNLVETTRFYSEVMELMIVESDDSHIVFKIGSSKLSFLHTDDENCVYHFAFDIPHNRLNEAVKWLSTRVGLIRFKESDVIDFPNWNAKSLYFYDNNGNVLEFIARFENGNDSYEAFESSSLISISEIAFVSDNVEQLADELIKTYDLTYYFRQQQSEEFSVIGDDEGLIILVKSTRNWFPTPVRVKKFPVILKIENQKKEFEISYK